MGYQFIWLDLWSTCLQWTSGIRSGSLNNYYWIKTGSAFTYTNWFQTQPDLNVNGACFVMNYVGQWADDQCTLRRQFVCEKWAICLVVVCILSAAFASFQHLKNKCCQDHNSLAPNVGFVQFILTKTTKTESNRLVTDSQHDKAPTFISFDWGPSYVIRQFVHISERIASSWLPFFGSFQSLNVSIAPGPGVDGQQLLSVNAGTGASQMAIFSAIRWRPSGWHGFVHNTKPTCNHVQWVMGLFLP